MNFLPGTIAISSPDGFGLYSKHFLSLRARPLHNCCERPLHPALIVVFNSFGLFCPVSYGRRLLETKPTNWLLCFRWKVRKHFTTGLSHTGSVLRKLCPILMNPERFSHLLPIHPGPLT